MAVGQQQQSGTPWWDAFPVTQSYGQNGETGTDYGTPFHTDITTPLGGTVVGTSYGGPGGEVFIQTTLPSGQSVTEAIVHLDDILVRVGQTLSPGQLVGLSGGQNVGGDHPAGPKYSSGAHTELDFFTGAPFASPSLDPVTVLQSIFHPFGPVDQPAVQQTKQNGPAIYLLPQAVNDLLSKLATNAVDYAWRWGLILAGIVVLIVGLVLLFRQPLTTAGEATGEAIQNNARHAAKLAEVAM